MTDIVERIEAALICRPIPPELLREARDEIGVLRAALQAMLDCHGQPHRADWISDAAFQHAVEVDAQARRALDEGLPTAEDVRGILREPKP